jgi:hypothetical protein
VGQQGSLDLEWEQVQAPGVEIRRMGTREKSQEGKIGNQGDHAGLPMRGACRAKQDLQWAWGTVGGFDPGSDPGLYWRSGLGRMREVVAGLVEVELEMEERAVEGFGHLERLAYQDQSSREVQKSRKQGKRRWRRWQH